MDWLNTNGFPERSDVFSLSTGDIQFDRHRSVKANHYVAARTIDSPADTN